MQISEKRAASITLLKNLLGDNINWYVSGSFANTAVLAPNDIDIYFYTEKDYQMASKIINPIGRVFKTPFADTYNINLIPFTIQLITKHFGEPQEIFDTMDLNVCKQAILRDGTHIIDPTALDPLTITNVSIDTFKRYVKYYKRFNPKRNLDKVFSFLFEQYISDYTPCISYYEDQPSIARNKTLYTLFQHHTKTKDISRRVQENIKTLIHDQTPDLLL